MCPEKWSVNKVRQNLLPMGELPSKYMGDSAFDDISKDIARLLTRNAHCLRSCGDELLYLIVHKEEQRRYNAITMTKAEWHGDA